MALVAGALVLGACEQKAPIVNIPPQTNPVTVTIAGAPTQPIKKGATVQLVAVVANTTNQAVTWSVVSGATVVSVSATGLVTALTPGTAVVQAVSQADPTAKDAVSVQVADTTTGGGTGGGQPSISIGSVTTNIGGLNAPVNPGNVAGQIDVTLNVDIPAGVNAAAVRTTLDGTEVCKQSFSGSGSSEAGVAGAQVPVTMVCSINTAGTKADGTPNFFNGVHTLKAEVLSPTGTTLASATYQPLTFNNIDVVNATVTTTKGPVTGADGLAWRGGDLTVAMVPTIYSGSANNATSLTVVLAPSANAAAQGTSTSSTADFNAGCSTTGRGGTGVATATCAAGTKALTDADATNGFSVTFSSGTRWALGGVGNLEDPNLAITINGITASGQNYAGNTVVRLGPNPISPANVLRMDNLAPRVNVFSITPATYINGAFTFSGSSGSTNCPNRSNGTVGGALASPCYGTVDYGADSQTSTFNIQTTAGAAVANGTGVTNAAAVAETPTSTTYVVQAVVTDVLGNSRSVYSAGLAGTVTTDVTAAAQFGVDLTVPTIAAGYLTPADCDAPQSNNPAGCFNNSSVNVAGANNTINFGAVDAGVGPSGIAGVRVKVEQITPTGTVCLNPATGTAFVAGNYGYTGSQATSANACGSTATVLLANPIAITLPDVGAYYRVSFTPVDIAGNVGATTTALQLRDFAAPLVGGLSSPSIIQGGTDVTFTTSLSDDVELGFARPWVQYTEVALGFTQIRYSDITFGSYGPDPLNYQAVGNITIPSFIRSIETAAPAPTGSISRANAVNVNVNDVAGNVTPQTVATTANVAAGIGGTGAETSFGAANRPFGAVSGTNPNGGGTSFTAATSGNVCSDNPQGAAAGCAVTPTTVTLTASATGPAQTFANPFARVVIYRISGTDARQVCTTSASAFDNTTLGTRTWQYSCSFSTGLAAGAYNFFALGVDAQGRALMTPIFVQTVVSD